MEHYAGIDLSLECSSVCALEASGKIVREAKVASEPEALISWLRSLGYEFSRIGLEAGPLSQKDGLSPCETLQPRVLVVTGFANGAG
jgi:transposase